MYYIQILTLKLHKQYYFILIDINSEKSFFQTCINNIFIYYEQSSNYLC